MVPSELASISSTTAFSFGVRPFSNGGPQPDARNRLTLLPCPTFYSRVVDTHFALFRMKGRNMSNRFTVADFQAEIAHTMQKPFLRIKGVTLPTKPLLKRMVNDAAPAAASQLLNSVVYEVSEDVVLDTIAKIEKSTRRQLVTTFWEARIPHEEMFIAWEIPKPDNMKDEGQQVFEGWLITKVRREHALAIRVDIPVETPETFYRYQYYVGEAGAGDKRLAITHVPISIANAGYSDDAQDEPWAVYETEYGTGMKDQAGLTLFEVLKRLVAIPKYGFTDPMTGKAQVDYNEWAHAINSDEQRMLNQISTMPTNFPEGDFDPYHGALRFMQGAIEEENPYAITMIKSFPKLLGFIAAQNFNWVFTEPVSRGKHTKNISSRMQPRNRHYKLEIKLPKEKQVIEGKQAKRTREFGNALHEVKGHKREYKNGRVIWIDAHQRGDAKYGIVTKDYVLTKDKKGGK